MYGAWRTVKREASEFGMEQQSLIAEPTTRTVISAYAEDARKGVGTLNADIAAYEVKQAEKRGGLLTKEEYENSELFTPGVAWYDGMTNESAMVQKEYQEAQNRRNQVFADASTGQTVVGMAAGFGAGIVEPKNLAIGVGVSLAAGPLATAGFLGNTARRIYQMRNVALKSRIAIGAAEGVVAGAITEPSNRYSAKVLQQDYTMADSLFNIATSTAFGAGVPVVGEGLSRVGAFMRGKADKFGGRTMDVVTHEADLATQQFMAGQRVDVRAIEAAESINVMKGTPEQKLKYAMETGVIEKPAVIADTAELEASGIQTDAAQFVPQQWRQDISPKTASELADPKSWVVRDKQTGEAVAEITQRDLAEKVNQAKYDVVPTVEHLANLNGQSYAATPTGVEVKAKQAALGNRDLDGVASEVQATARAAIEKHNNDAGSINNDTLIDYSAIDSQDAARVKMDEDALAETYFQEAEAEIRQMEIDGIVNEADLTEYRSALEELRKYKTVDALESLKICLTRG